MFSSAMTKKAKHAMALLAGSNRMLCSAESCTGGLFSASITMLPGASGVFERGYITYSNASKIELLTVPTYFIEDYGAVSLETAIAMAEGALLMSRADVSVAITGVAGPDGGTKEKPVGTVFIATAIKNGRSMCQRLQLSGKRLEIQLTSVEAALDAVCLRLEEPSLLTS